jgi:hypothetical protein
MGARNIWAGRRGSAGLRTITAHAQLGRNALRYQQRTLLQFLLLALPLDHCVHAAFQQTHPGIEPTNTGPQMIEIGRDTFKTLNKPSHTASYISDISLDAIQARADELQTHSLRHV